MNKEPQDDGDDITQAPPSLQKYLFLKRTCGQHTIHEILSDQINV